SSTCSSGPRRPARGPGTCCSPTRRSSARSSAATRAWSVSGGTWPGERRATPVTLTELLLRGSSASIVVFVVSSALGVGLGLTVRQILNPLRNARLVALSLFANFVLMPAAALGLGTVLRLEEPYRIGLLLCGLAAGAPFLIKLAEFAKADPAFGVGLMVLLMVVTVGYVPLILPIFVSGTAVNPAQIAASLVVLMLIPLAAGLLLRARG